MPVGNNAYSQEAVNMTYRSINHTTKHPVKRAGAIGCRFVKSVLFRAIFHAQPACKKICYFPKDIFKRTTTSCSTGKLILCCSCSVGFSYGGTMGLLMVYCIGLPVSWLTVSGVLFLAVFYALFAACAFGMMTLILS